MSGFANKVPRDTRILLQNKQVMPKDTGLSEANETEMHDTNSSPLSREFSDEVNQEFSFSYYVEQIAHGFWQWFKRLPFLIRVLLVLLFLYILPQMMNILLQFVIPSLNSIYTVLGIITSIIAIHEFFIKSSKKKS